jgi:hypothetical protein
MELIHIEGKRNMQLANFKCNSKKLTDEDTYSSTVYVLAA